MFQTHKYDTQNLARDCQTGLQDWKCQRQLDCTLKDFILSAPLYKVHIMVDFTHVNIVLIIVWCIYSETVGEPGCADYSAE